MNIKGTSTVLFQVFTADLSPLSDRLLNSNETWHPHDIWTEFYKKIYEYRAIMETQAIMMVDEDQLLMDRQEVI
jgi:hypothetical protein